MTFAAWLRTVREKSGLSQVEVARRANLQGITQATISRWEGGTHIGQPTVGQLGAMANAMGLDSEELERGIALAVAEARPKPARPSAAA